MVFELVMPAAWDVPANPDPDALLALPWIRMSPRSAHFDMMREIQQQIGAPRLEVMEADHEAVIHALVAAGVGIGLLRQELAEMGEARGELKRLRTCAATARLSFIHAVERQSDPAMVAVVSALRPPGACPTPDPADPRPRTRPAPGPLPPAPGPAAEPPSRRAFRPACASSRHGRCRLP